MFLFVGYDMILIFFVWVFYFFYWYFKVYEVLVVELDVFFGFELGESFELMKYKLLSLGGDELFNNMVYIIVVIKEMLCLCLLVGMVRMVLLGSNFVVYIFEG